MNILITSAGQRVSLVRAFQKQLRSVFPEGKVYTTDMQPQLSAACNVSDGYFKVKRVTDPAYMEELKNCCIENSIKMVIPTIDTELLVLSRHKTEFALAGIHLVVCDEDFTAKCRDKRLIMIFSSVQALRYPVPLIKKPLYFHFS